MSCYQHVWSTTLMEFNIYPFALILFPDKPRYLGWRQCFAANTDVYYFISPLADMSRIVAFRQLLHSCRNFFRYCSRFSNLNSLFAHTLFIHLFVHFGRHNQLKPYKSCSVCLRKISNIYGLIEPRQQSDSLS